MRKKIAIINQRYGSEVNGGSEYYTKKLAEHLSEFYEIEVITTTALDYDTWKPYYPEGVQTVDGVRVRRFSVEKTRNIKYFKFIVKIMRVFPFFWRILEPIWLKAQGPYCPRLIQYIRKNKENFDTFIFVTYLYYTTVAGLPEVADKAVLVPTAHDEYCIYFHMYKRLFKHVKKLAYLTEEEKQFVEHLYVNKRSISAIVGSGIDMELLSDGPALWNKYGVKKPYLIYVGRVDLGKKCDELFSFFEKYKVDYPSKLKLLVVGKIMMKNIPSKDIIFTGYVAQKEKNILMSNAQLLILPSDNESLSLTVLESMSMRVPVLVNGKCEVLKGHCERSQGGLFYYNYEQFKDKLNYLFRNENEYKKMQDQGFFYVKNKYGWDNTIKKFRNLIEIKEKRDEQSKDNF